MKLFLGGGGNGKDSIELDKKFVSALDLSKAVLYIPIAVDTQEYPYSDCVTWLSNVLGPLGVTNIIMWVEEDLRQKTEKDFEQFSGVYIGGGNTFKLLKELKEFGTFEILRKLTEKDIPIYGGSAGAVIWGVTINTAAGHDENYLGLIDLSALNLINGYEIWPHYIESEEEKVKEYMHKYQFEKVIAIPETSGLFVTNSSIEAVGPSSIKIFEGDLNRIVKPVQEV